MKRFATKRNFFVLAAITALAALLAAYLFPNRERSLDPAEAAAAAGTAADGLSSTTAEVSLAISVTAPGLQEAQEFSGRGIADFGREGASLTYDFEELTNAAGGFGHLEEFDVVFEKDLVYIQIFEGNRPWVSFRPPEIVGLDLERLREVVLSSPLVLPDYLRSLREVAGTAEGTRVVVKGTVVPSILPDPAHVMTSEFQELLTELDAGTVSVTAQIQGGVATHIDYEIGFSPVSGSQEEVVARIAIDLERSEVEEIVVPNSSETRPLESFLE